MYYFSFLEDKVRDGGTHTGVEVKGRNCVNLHSFNGNV
jgi:hypothetical protein